MPHPVAVDRPRHGLLGNFDHAAVDMLGNARDLWWSARPRSFGPILPHQLLIAAERHHDGLRMQGKLAVGLARTGPAPLDRI